jgi:hypothetical protein
MKQQRTQANHRSFKSRPSPFQNFAVSYYDFSPPTIDRVE